MARKARGYEQIGAAKKLLHDAKTADEIRMAQAVLLPLEMGLSLQQTATIIGRSISTTSTCRNKFLRSTQEQTSLFGKKRFMRNRAYLSFDDEAQMLNDLLEESAHGEVIITPPLREKIEQRLGKKVALSTIYRMLARHGWRKLAPDTAHTKSDAAVREDWKKNFPAKWKK
jgi:transposase